MGGGVAIQWSCHRKGWPAPAAHAPAPSPPIPTANSTDMPESYDTCIIPIGDATQVDGNIRLTPAEQVDAVPNLQHDGLAPRSSVTDIAGDPDTTTNMAI